MKKLICAVLMFSILFASFPCISSAMTEDEYKQQIRASFADTTDDQLKFLFEAVQYELMCRGFKFDFDENHVGSVQKEETEQKEVTVPAGEYTVGEDIPSGTYTVTATGLITVLIVKDSDGSTDAMHSLQSGSSIGKLVLKDGQTVEITGTEVIFKPYSGIGF